MPCNQYCIPNLYDAAVPAANKLLLIEVSLFFAWGGKEKDLLFFCTKSFQEDKSYVVVRYQLDVGWNIL